MGLPSIGIIAFHGINPFLFSIPYSIFGIAELEKKLFDVHIATVNDEDVKMDAAITIAPAIKLSDLESLDIVIVPGWPDFNLRPDPATTLALKRAHNNGALIIGLCFGAYALAYSGLLEGREATTHWLAEDDFRKRFPNTKLNNNSLYVEDGAVITSAGSAAGIDCCIYVINKLYGYRIANSAARIMVSSPYREGGQAQFMDLPAKLPQGPGINAITEFLVANIKNDYTLDELAQKFSMSRRTLIRHFVLATGMSVKKWVTSMRLRRSCELLESTNWSIERIAEESGFGTAALLRRHFSRQYHLSPLRWRECFFNGEPVTAG